MLTRRQTLGLSAALAGAMVAPKARAAEPHQHMHADMPDTPAPAVPGSYRPVVTPDGGTLPFRMVDGVKVFHLIAEPVEHEFAPGLKAGCWGYNGRVHGPTIEAVEGDRVRVYVTNRLPAATTVHWHGVILPNGMDGVGGLNQPSIPPGETYRYEWTFRQHGTFMYHSHHDEMTQMGMGLMGMIVVHPREPSGPPPDRDYVFMLSEWKVEPGTARPDPNEMTDFNILTLNAKCFPGTSPLVAGTGERVRIRFGNLSAMHHHPIHLHGYAFRTIETDGGPVPEHAQWPETTVLVPVGATRTIEFIADAPGDWAMHCHMTHHLMNQMGHGLPNMVGADAGAIRQAIEDALPHAMVMGTVGMEDMSHHMAMGHMAMPANSIAMKMVNGPHGVITMGGMFTILKVRDNLSGDKVGGWYKAETSTVARAATAEELRRDGIDAGGAPPVEHGHGHHHS